MTRALITAVSALQSYQQRMDVDADNVANVNTASFKSSKLASTSASVQTMRAPSAQQPVGIQIGLGNQVSAVNQNFSQGAFQRTGIPTDLALSGDGFMMVNSGSGGSGTSQFVRDGAFTLDRDGFVITAQGDRLQGVTADWDTATNPPTLTRAADDPGIIPDPVTGVPQDGTIGDLLIPSTFTAGGVTETRVNYTIDTDGKITLYGNTGNAYVAGYITVARFTNPAGLEKAGNNLYNFNSAAGSMSGGDSFNPVSDVRQAGKSGTASIQSGALELSNVDLAETTTDMIITQNAFDSNAKVIITADEMLQTLNSLKK